MGVQVGAGSVMINVFRNVAAPPLDGGSGVIESPYRGLAAFERRDEAFFFGREEAAGEVLGRMSRALDGRELMMVSGVSGVGKSSLLRAGVLPGLLRQGLAGAPGAAAWPLLMFTPGPSPLDELAALVAPLAGAEAGAVRHAVAADPAGFAGYVRRRRLLALLGGLVSVVIYCTTLWAMTEAPVAVVAALRETSILFATVISVVVLKEKVGLRRLALVCAIAGGAMVLRLA
jgi:hypothetical protein